MKKILATHMFFLVIVAGLRYFDLQGPNLAWNMVLALASLDMMWLAVYVKQKWLSLMFLILWFFFYPNTFYMVTDIVHMHFVGSVLHNPESMKAFMLYVSSIFFGVMTGLEGVSLLMAKFPIKNFWLRGLFFSLLSLVSSLAIHIGRYARLNSWDIFTRPLVVVDEILAVISREALVFVLGFTCLQVMCLVMLDKNR